MKRLLFLLLLISSATANAMDDQTKLNKLDRFDSIVSEVFHPKALQTRQGIENLGKTIKKTEKAWKTSSGNEWLSIVYEFQGLSVIAHFSKQKPKLANVSKIVIKSSNWPLSNGIYVGQKLIEAEDMIINQLVEYTKGSGQYCGLNNCIIAKHKNGVIHELEIELYFDVWPA